MTPMRDQTGREEAAVTQRPYAPGVPGVPFRCPNAGCGFECHNPDHNGLHRPCGANRGTHEADHRCDADYMRTPAGVGQPAPPAIAPDVEAQLGAIIGEHALACIAHRSACTCHYREREKAVRAAFSLGVESAKEERCGSMRSDDAALGGSTTASAASADAGRTATASRGTAAGSTNRHQPLPAGEFEGLVYRLGAWKDQLAVAGGESGVAMVQATIDALVRLRREVAEWDRLPPLIQCSRVDGCKLNDFDEVIAERDALRTDLDRAREEGAAAWPPRNVVNALIAATGHLLRDHDCDHHGYEEWTAALDAARAARGERGDG